jgi:putative addiction module killer protein
VNRIELCNFGDHKFCRDGVWELRIDVNAGYRVYYAIAGKEIVLLLCGGDKRTQGADIDHACEYWQDWQRRSNDGRHKCRSVQTRLAMRPCSVCRSGEDYPLQPQAIKQYFSLPVESYSYSMTKQHGVML